MSIFAPALMVVAQNNHRIFAFGGTALSLFPKPHHPFPLSAVALAKEENLLLAFIYLCNK